MSSVYRALLLLASVQAAIENGVAHYDSDGNLLEGAEDVLEALQRGEVRIDESQRVERVRVIDIFDKLRKEKLH